MKSQLAIVLASLMPLSSHAELFISEYIEGSGYNKALEIYNPSQSNIDLSAYQFKLFQNSNNTPSYTINLSGNIAPGGTYVVAHQDISDDSQVDLLVNNLQHNGNDTIVLYKNDEVIDSIGKIAEGINWSNNGVTTKDRSLVRKSDIANGDSNPNDAFDPSIEWESFPKNTLVNLGSHNFNGVIDDNDGNDNGGDTDNGSGGDNNSDNAASCGDATTLIADIQGESSSTPLNGETVWDEGIVTISLQASGYNGFYLQDLPTNTDSLATTSNGIFVYHSADNVTQGSHIRFQAKAGEYNNQTQLSNVSELTVCQASIDLPAPVAMSLPMLDSEREAFEGMLITLPQDMFVTDTYNYGRYGQIGLATERLYNPTQIVAPGEEANQVATLNDSKTVYLDDLSTEQNPSSLPYPAPEMTPNNPLRSGNTVQNITGVLAYSFGNWVVLPISDVNVIQTNPRTAEPLLAAEGNLRVASFNVLNYFNGNGQGSEFPTARGANTSTEFDRQRDKIINAISALDADIIGLMEIENDGYDQYSAIADLVNGLNDSLNGNQYSFIAPSVAKIGTDEIAVGIIYNHDVVSAAGAAQILDSSNSVKDDANNPLFIDNKNRPVLTQTFTLLENGQAIAVAVAHLKSKGGSCDSINDPDTGDGQGSCNITRTKAAQATAAFLQSNFADTPTILIGDLNAYAKEDPLTALNAEGFNDVFTALEKTQVYSYIFGGALGQLDHALANSALMPSIIDAQFWPINADEPRVLDYNVEYQSADAQAKFYANDAFRSSDHDPVIIEIQLNAPEVFGDFDGDQDIDRNDVSMFYQMLRRQEITDMRYDFNSDGLLNTRDVRGLMGLCTYNRCASQ